MRFIVTLLFINLYTLANAQIFTPVGVASKVSFQINNFGSSVDGTFKELKGTIELDFSNPMQSKFDVTVDAGTVDTGIGMRDKHLRKEDYFDVENHKMIRFTSTLVKLSSQSKEGTVTGNLSIKDTTKEISFPFKYSIQNDEIRLTGKFELNRREFEVGGSSISLSDDLTVTLDVLAKQ
ncbi:MAG: YceI family protein [Reichenbachiella sp.]